MSTGPWCLDLVSQNHDKNAAKAKHKGSYRLTVLTKKYNIESVPNFHR